jgi:hypothetical protein
MVAAQVAFAIAIVVQRQTFATNSALVAVEAEITTWIETLSLSEDNRDYLSGVFDLAPILLSYERRQAPQ